MRPVSSRRQSWALVLQAYRFEAVVTSPLRRCRQTAQAVLSGQSNSCVMAVDQRLVECGYGEWTGKSLRELSKDKLWRSVQQQPSAVRFPVVKQCLTCLREQSPPYAIGTREWMLSRALMRFGLQCRMAM